MRLPPPDSESEGPNLTPIIDVVFLLLIFFLVATRFVQEERELEAQLPEVVAARPLASGFRQIIVNVTDKGQYTIEGNIYNEKQLESLLHQENLKNPDMQTVQIRADERGIFKYPVKVMGICQREKIKFTIAALQVK